MKAFLVNDTSKYHFGTRMVIKTIEEQLEARGVELVGRSPSKHTFRRYRPILDTVDLVIVNGEGSLHGGRRRDLFDVALEYPSVLINFSFENHENYPSEAARAFKYVTPRETISISEWQSFSDGWRGNLHNCAPDLSLMQDVITLPPLMDIGLFDSVETKRDERDTWMSPFGEGFVPDSQKYKRWVVGRLHVACLAIILNKAFTAYDTHTHKLEGLMKDAGLGERFYISREDALGWIPKKPNTAQGEYLEHARKRIPEMFDEICNL